MLVPPTQGHHPPLDGRLKVGMTFLVRTVIGVSAAIGLFHFGFLVWPWSMGDAVPTAASNSPAPSQLERPVAVTREDLNAVLASGNLDAVIETLNVVKRFMDDAIRRRRYQVTTKDIVRVNVADILVQADIDGVIDIAMPRRGPSCRPRSAAPVAAWLSRPCRRSGAWRPARHPAPGRNQTRFARHRPHPNRNDMVPLTALRAGRIAEAVHAVRTHDASDEPAVPPELRLA